MSSTAAGPSTANVVSPVGIAQASGPVASSLEATSLRDITRTQWKSGAAAWLGWLFDGLDMHLYTLVAMPFVAELLHVDQSDKSVGLHASWIQAAFLIGWALGGAFFGLIGDKLGRSRTLVLTILTYAAFTGLSFFATTWWHLFICRFLAALGIGGEWAVGASLLCETWPKRWRPWMAAVLQSAVNVGVLMASIAVFLLASYPYRTVFLVGVLPAAIVFWIRKAVPETEEWHAARAEHCETKPVTMDLFRGAVRRTTLLTITVCAFSLTAHWAFMFWYAQHLGKLPDVQSWGAQAIGEFKSKAMVVVMIASIIGNFLAALLARLMGYRMAILLMCLAYCGAMLFTYGEARDYRTLFNLLWAVGICQGVFGLFTMYLPPLFPTLLRTTGAGFCYNIGRIAAAIGTVYFGTLATHAVKIDYGITMFYAAFLFLPAAAAVMFMTEPPDERPAPAAGVVE